jgi:hypothetical protein
MVKGFHTVIDPTEPTKSHNQPTTVRALETNDQDKNMGLGVAPAQLMNWRMPCNRNLGKLVSMTANVFNPLINWRPLHNFRRQLRTLNTTNGTANRQAVQLDLANGSGAAGAGDVAVITWVHDGSQNDNIESVTLYMSRVGSGATSFIRVALFDITALSTGGYGALDTVAAGVGVTPLTLDHLHYYANSQLAYSQRPFDDVTTDVNGAPITFELPYNAREDRGAGVELVDGNVYAIVVYLLRGGAETADLYLHGSNVAADDLTSVTYRGAAGWNGAMVIDANLKAAFYELDATRAAVINKITLHAPTGNTLGGFHLAKCAVQPDSDDTIENVRSDGKWGVIHHREIIKDKVIGDQVISDVIFEGKGILPRRTFLKMIAMAGFTGDLNIDINYWIDVNGDARDYR